MRSRGIAPVRKELRNGSSKSERESTSGRSTNYASGHLIRVFRDIGRIFSLTLGASFHCSSFSATRRPLVTRCEGGVQKWKTQYDFVEGKKRFQLCFVGTHPVKERDAVRSIQAHLGTTGQLNRRPGPLAIPLRTSEITGGRGRRFTKSMLVGRPTCVTGH